MNRAERRKLIRQYAKDKDAEKCPICDKKSRFVSVPTKNWLCDVQCELCGSKVAEDCKGLLPMTYVSLREMLHPTEKGGEQE